MKRRQVLQSAILAPFVGLNLMGRPPMVTGKAIQQSDCRDYINRLLDEYERMGWDATFITLASDLWEQLWHECIDAPLTSYSETGLITSEIIGWTDRANICFVTHSPGLERGAHHVWGFAPDNPQNRRNPDD